LKIRWISFTCFLALSLPFGSAQDGKTLSFSSPIVAGTPFIVQTNGSGKGTLYIVGLGQVIKREIDLGKTAYFESGALHSAGHYVVFLAGTEPAQANSLDVAPASEAGDLTFLAKPSRLPVSIQGGITGAVYVFDLYSNLVTKPLSVNFQLSNPSGSPEARTVTTSNGVAWTRFDSTAHEGADKFVASIGPVSSSRVIGQVPGDPCGLKMSASPAGRSVRLQTEPVRDCSGNPVPDGTVITFTEAYAGAQSTVDVPIKRGVAEVQMPLHPGAVVTVASGVVMGNQIRLGGR
jgi:hypothetical protein